MLCRRAQQALHACKAAQGLLPNQCYPMKGYGGECDESEYEYKKCISFAANPGDARILYDPKQSRLERMDANKRLMKRLKAFNQPCKP